MGLHFLKTSLSHPIPEHKELTENRQFETFQPDRVYVPAVDSRNNPLQHLVEVGSTVFKGSLIGLGVDNFPVYSSVSGTVIAKKYMMMADGRVRECLEIENDHVSRWMLRPPLPPVKDCKKEDILFAIKDSGTIGFGGAGFPTYRKYQTKAKINYIIINAIECEPYLTTDYSFGSAHLPDVFKAIPYLIKVSGCKKVFFAVKKGRTKLIKAFEIESKKKENRNLPVELKVLPDRYPMGYERTLVKKILGKDYKTLPSEVGAIVNNLYTLIALGRRFAFGEVAVDRCITVTGDIQTPTDLYVPYGALASDLVNRCGGPVVSKFKFVNGGPMCGNSHESDYVTQLQSNGVLVLKPMKKNVEPCWHCGKCIDNCPMGLQPVQIQLAMKAGNVERIRKLDANLCINCGLCSFVCPSRIDVSQNVQKAKSLLVKGAAQEGGEKK